MILPFSIVKIVQIGSSNLEPLGTVPVDINYVFFDQTKKILLKYRCKIRNHSLSEPIKEYE